MIDDQFADPEEKYLADLAKGTKQSLIAEIRELRELRKTLHSRANEAASSQWEKDRQEEKQRWRNQTRRGLRATIGFILIGHQREEFG